MFLYTGTIDKLINVENLKYEIKNFRYNVKTASSLLKYNFYKKCEDYYIDINIPGKEKEEISVSFKDDLLCIGINETDDNVEYIIKNFSINDASWFEFTFNTLINKVKPVYKNGILSIKIVFGFPEKREYVEVK